MIAGAKAIHVHSLLIRTIYDSAYSIGAFSQLQLMMQIIFLVDYCYHKPLKHGMRQDT